MISDLSCQDLNDPVVWGFCSRVYPDFLILLNLFQFLIVAFHGPVKYRTKHERCCVSPSHV